ncbi:MAG TPA: CsiV family protein [Gammaproteobacteria bacterium]
MKLHPLARGVTACAAVLTVGAAAQEPSGGTSVEAPEPPVPLYRVEIIVFANEGGDPNEEYFRHHAAQSTLRELADAGPLRTFDFSPWVPADPFAEDPSGDTDDPFADADATAGGLGERRRARREDVLRARVEAAASREGGLDRPGRAGTIGPVGSESTPPVEADGAARPGAGGTAEQPGAQAADGASAAGDANAAAAPPSPLAGPPDLAFAPFPFRRLAPDELRLTDAYQRLDSLDGYTPLVHVGWIQEGLPLEEAQPFDLSYLGVANPAGSIRLHVSRYLHVTLDLDYRPQAAFGAPGAGVGAADGEAPAGEPGALGPSGPRTDPSGAFGGAAAGAGRPGSVRNDRSAPAGARRGPGRDAFAPIELSEIALPPHYTLSVERRVRSGEIHYFDHPRFGVVIAVEPYEVPAESSDDVRPAA